MCICMYIYIFKYTRVCIFATGYKKIILSINYLAKKFFPKFVTNS